MEDNTLTPLTFETFSHQNGITYWLASEVMRMLGYSDMKKFEKVIDRATKAFISLGIPHRENIIDIGKGENEEQDFKLTRFACYLIAMNGDPKKPEVAMAQAYFVEQTRKFELYVQDNEEIDRLIIRDELTDGNKSLSATAKNASVEDYPKFQNAGYIGLYNMTCMELERRRGCKRHKLFDSMGRTELAANLFRVTMTEELIKKSQIKGQNQLERAHKEVGSEVRNLVIKNTGTTPENLPQEKTLPEIKKEIKKGYRKMKELK